MFVVCFLHDLLDDQHMGPEGCFPHLKQASAVLAPSQAETQAVTNSEYEQHMVWGSTYI